MMRRYDNILRRWILRAAPLVACAASVAATRPVPVRPVLRTDRPGIAADTVRRRAGTPEERGVSRAAGDSVKRPDPIRGSKDLAIPALTAALVPIVRPAARAPDAPVAPLTPPPADAAARGRLSAAARAGVPPAPTLAGVPVPKVAGRPVAPATTPASAAPQPGAATAAAPTSSAPTGAAGTAAAVGGTPAASATTSLAPTVGTDAAAAPAAPVPGVLGKPITAFDPDVTRVAAPNVAAALATFVRGQLGSERVKHAQVTADAPLRAAFAKVGLSYPAARVYLRAFKREHELEVWGAQADGSFVLVKTYSICSLGGSTLGPKLRRGDEQVPEGFYHLVEFNPVSEYHLSLRLDYPNAADLVRSEAQRAGNLGGDIYLHGGCKSAGCLPLTDAGIEEIYWLAVQARAGGEKEIPIDIFPARLDGEHWTQLTSAFAGRKDLLTFWSDLKLGYDAFERTHRLPDVSIDASGRYRVALVGR